MPEENFSLEQFRAMKDAGVDPYAQGSEVDAAPQEELDYVETEENESPDTDEIQSEDSDNLPEADRDSEIPVQSGQEDAFYKRLQRERKKLEAELAEKYKKEAESQYDPYRQLYESMGLGHMNPQEAMKFVEENKMKQEAERLAYQNGWTDEQTEMFVRQQKLEREQTEMRVNLRVYELSETKDFPGIKGMKGAITDFIRRNPSTSVEQAYYAVGGPQLVKQMKLEAEQRAAANREKKPSRTVLTDGGGGFDKGPAPMSPEQVAFMKRTGLSESDFRKFYMNDKGPGTLDDYRRSKKG
jgi:hypothetical protein